MRLIFAPFPAAADCFPFATEVRLRFVPRLTLFLVKITTANGKTDSQIDHRRIRKMEIESRYEKRYIKFTSGEISDSFSSCLLSQFEDWPTSFGSDVRGFRIQLSDSSLARSSANMTDALQDRDTGGQIAKE